MRSVPVAIGSLPHALPHALPHDAEAASEEAAIPLIQEADERIRTADPIITSDVLYQLSYVGEPARPRPRVVEW